MKLYKDMHLPECNKYFPHVEELSYIQWHNPLVSQPYMAKFMQASSNSAITQINMQ